MTPSAVKTGDSVVALDLFPALGALCGRVALHPVVQHPLGGPGLKIIKLFTSVIYEFL